MPTSNSFRLSLYLTLGLACVCVGYAEHALFPEVPFIAAAVIGALVLLYRLESRVQLLSIPAANRLGLVVGLLNLVWAAMRIVQVSNQPGMSSTNLQFVLVALFGTLLLTLIPAKLARREQHVGDYWALYAMALVAVCLGGAMAEDPVSFLLMGCYAVAAVWSLCLFQFRRAAGTVAPLPNRPAPMSITGILCDPQSRSCAKPALRLGLLAAAIALPLYLLTPPSPGEKLEFGKSRVEVGFSASQMVDLNTTGNLENNPAPAFEVTLETVNGLLPQLPEDQLWRGRVLRQYSKGTWENSDIPLPGVDSGPRSNMHWRPPHLGPGQVTLAFAVPPSLPVQVLAEPVIWGRDQPVPIATRTPIGWQPWLWGGDGSFYWPGRHRRNATLQYVQLWRAKAEPNLSPRFHLTDSNPDERIRPLLQNPVPRVKEHADRLVDKLIQEGQLPADCRDPNTGLPRPSFHDRIAQAFNNHLATTPELRYTTKLRRTRKDVDPVEDFLFHTRAGHCERFASALALMLRSQGIPAVLVLGFKGWEATADPQQYIVKQDHAHAWVEALIVEFESPPPGTNERPVSRWRSLDPTPTGQPSTDTPSEGWVALARDWVQERFRGVLTSVTSTEGLVTTFGRWEVLAAGCLVVLAVVLRRWFPSPRTSTTPASPESALLGRLLAVLAAHGFAPVPGDTPLEFTTTVSDALGKSPATAAVAGVPTDFAEAYYESRFGGRVLSQERLAALDAALGELERALKLASTAR